MKPERIQKLESIGFQDKAKTIWDQRFQELKQYHKDYSHCNVPNVFPENKALGRWVNNQRQQYKKFLAGDSKSSMTPERIQKLESVGFQWQLRKRK